MRILVCGDRGWRSQERINQVLDAIHHITPISLIIEGEARGADIMSKNWAISRGIPWKEYPANWEKFGRAAGPIRNRQQFNEGKPDEVIAFHDDISQSKGTKDMVNYAQSKNCPVRIFTMKGAGDGDSI